MTTERNRIESARNGDTVALEQLRAEYKSVVLHIARSYFLSGADREDLVQEGMIGLYRAINTYDSDMRASFSTYAHSCVRNRMRDAVKRANRDKHRVLNDAVSLTQYDRDEQNAAPSPEEETIETEASGDIRRAIEQHLDDEERALLQAYLCGLSYREIAETLGKSVKSVDNALQSVKRKLRKLLNDDASAHAEI